MNMEKYIVRLASVERQELESIVNKLKESSQKVKRAIVLLKADADGPNWTNEKIHDLTGVSFGAISRLRKQLVTAGFEATIHRKKRMIPPREKKLNGLQEATLIATRCGSPPEGFGKWSFLNWRRVSVREQRKKLEWAEEIEQLVMVDFKDADRITLVLDNLNTHTPGAFYKRFKPEYARTILRRLELVYTPIHGSWLNIAENELSVLTKQCLCVRIGTIEEMHRQVAGWTNYRNKHSKGVDWQVTTDDARIKLKSVYPVYQFDEH